MAVAWSVWVGRPPGPGWVNRSTCVSFLVQGAVLSCTTRSLRGWFRRSARLLLFQESQHSSVESFAEDVFRSDSGTTWVLCSTTTTTGCVGNFSDVCGTKAPPRIRLSWTSNFSPSQPRRLKPPTPSWSTTEDHRPLPGSSIASRRATAVSIPDPRSR